MDIKAAHRFARISPKKVRPVVAAIVGKQMNQALATLSSSPRRAAAMVSKVLKSAAANAENSEKVECDPGEMIVTVAKVDDGPRMSRYKYGARGRILPRVKRMAHITICLSERKTDGSEG